MILYLWVLVSSSLLIYFTSKFRLLDYAVIKTDGSQGFLRKEFSVRRKNMARNRPCVKAKDK